MKYGLILLIVFSGVFFNAQAQVSCTGIFEQGGSIICQAPPETVLHKQGNQAIANAQGIAFIGFDRDELVWDELRITYPDGTTETQPIEIMPHDYAISHIDGLPAYQVSDFTKAQLRRIELSTLRKQQGYSSRADLEGFMDGFVYPVQTYQKTSPYGAQRVLNGTPKRPHYGVDLAAVQGTPVLAPADGLIVLADMDLYFEGAMVMIDHGQGVISSYLHVDDIFVSVGQTVKRGDKIASVGAKGRATGPHLCWRLKWRDRNLNPELLTHWPPKLDTDEAHFDTLPKDR